VNASVRRLLVSHGLASLSMSLPWPLLLALAWEQTHDPTWLGVAAAARMLPYVACSWWVGRLADRYPRAGLVRVTLWARLVLLAGTGLAVSAGWTAAAVALAALVVAVATPAFPAQAAALPTVAGDHARRATQVLVTLEVSSFVVGPAVGGLFLGVPVVITVGAVVGTAAALVCFSGLDLGTASGAVAAGPAPSPYRALVERRGLAPTIAMMAGLNFVLAGASLALLPLADTAWSGTWGSATAYGLATAVLGFGALAGPVLARLGRDDASRTRAGLGLGAASLGVVALAPTVDQALLPLLVVGAAAVHAESAATSLIQDRAPDGVRAGILGVADAAMIGMALVGSLVAPALLDLLGGPALLLSLALALAASIGLVPRRRPSHRAGRASEPDATPAEVEWAA